MIKIKKSPTADTRTCDFSKVTEDQLNISSVAHISDVRKAISFFQSKLQHAANKHDWTKISIGKRNQFFSDFKTGFKEHTWFDEHKKLERHHINYPDAVRDDIDIVDVLEFISDCVMAGMARSGSVYELKLPNELLQKAFNNTVEKLKAEIIIEEKD